MSLQVALRDAVLICKDGCLALQQKETVPF